MYQYEMQWRRKVVEDDPRDWRSWRHFKRFGPAHSSREDAKAWLRTVYKGDFPYDVCGLSAEKPSFSLITINPKKKDTKVQNQVFKADGGKVRPSLLFEGMPKSLMLIIAVLEYGAVKYEPHSHKRVDPQRYTEAKLRHMMEIFLGYHDIDIESGLMHEAHELTCALFVLEQKLDKLTEQEFRELLKFNQPPTEHKIAAELVTVQSSDDDLVSADDTYDPRFSFETETKD